MKHDPEDLHGFADDIARAIGNHPDAMDANKNLKEEAQAL